jgi:hypothetical protein
MYWDISDKPLFSFAERLHLIFVRADAEFLVGSEVAELEAVWCASEIRTRVLRCRPSFHLLYVSYLQDAQGKISTCRVCKQSRD